MADPAPPPPGLSLPVKQKPAPKRGLFGFLGGGAAKPSQDAPRGDAGATKGSWKKMLGLDLGPNWTKEEAFMCILVGAGFVDGHRDAREEEEVKALLHRLRIFKEMGAGKMDELHERVVRRLHPNAATPLDTKLVLSTCESACKKLKSEKLGESVFVNAVDIAFADTEIEPEEVSYLNMLVEKLELPVERANALINFIKIKNHNMG